MGSSVVSGAGTASSSWQLPSISICKVQVSIQGRYFPPLPTAKLCRLSLVADAGHWTYLITDSGQGGSPVTIPVVTSYSIAITSPPLSSLTLMSDRWKVGSKACTILGRTEPSFSRRNRRADTMLSTGQSRAEKVLLYQASSMVPGSTLLSTMCRVSSSRNIRASFFSSRTLLLDSFVPSSRVSLNTKTNITLNFSEKGLLRVETCTQGIIFIHENIGPLRGPFFSALRAAILFFSSYLRQHTKKSYLLP